jgi:hypothetical protein
LDSKEKRELLLHRECLDALRRVRHAEWRDPTTNPVAA